MSKSIKTLAAIGFVAVIAACAQQEAEFVVVEPELCLLDTSDAAGERDGVASGCGRGI